MNPLPSLSALQEGDEQAWGDLEAQLFPIALAAARTKLYGDFQEDACDAAIRGFEVASISRTVRKGESSTMKPIKESSPKTRRKFDPTFKREAVGNWLSSGRSAAVVAKELGLTEGLLFAWRTLLPP